MSSDHGYYVDAFKRVKRAPRKPQGVKDEDTEDASQGQFLSDYSLDDKRPLMISEVYHFLKQAQTNPESVDLDKNEIFVKTVEYVERFNHYRDSDNLAAVRQKLEEFTSPLPSKPVLTPFEVVTIANLQLNLQEAISFLPSLVPDHIDENGVERSNFEEALNFTLTDISQYREIPN